MDDRQFDSLMVKLEMIRGCIIHVETAVQNIKAELPSASHNTGSPKLPTFEEVWNYVARLPEPKTNDELNHSAINLVRAAYDYICRQLRAGA